MGLLDNFDDPQTTGLLSMGLRLMSTPGSFGRAFGTAGLGAMGDVQDARQRIQQRKLQEQQSQANDLHMQMQRQQLAEMQRQGQQQQRAQEFLSTLPSPQMQASGQALAGGGGPTVANAQRMPAVDPMQQLMFGAVRSGAMPLQSYITSMHNDETPISLADGGMLVTRGGKVLAQNPKDISDKLPEVTRLMAQREMLPMGDPRRLIYDAAIQKATTHQEAPRLTVIQKAEEAYKVGQGKEFSDLMSGINKAGFVAPSQLRKLERMEQLLKDVDGGRLSGTGLEVASALNSMGIKVDPRLGNKEAAEALARDMAGGLRQPGTGPMTDKDFDNFMTQIPGLSKSSAGRAQITSTMRAALNRDIEVAKRAREYVRRKGVLDDGFLDEVSQYVAETPVVGAPQGWKVQR